MTILPTTPQRRLRSRRWVYRTLREVYFEDDREVVKRFVHYPGRRDRRRVWEREDRALRRLEGLPVPKTYGYQQGRCPDGPEFILRKEYIAGTSLTEVLPRDARDMGELLARIHARGVVTGDPSLENFLRTPQGDLYFLDFGRARIFNRRTPLFYVYLGKDLARFYRTSLLGRTDIWKDFLEKYHATLKPRPIIHWLINAGLRFWLHHWRYRPYSKAPQ